VKVQRLEKVHTQSELYATIVAASRGVTLGFGCPPQFFLSYTCTLLLKVSPLMFLWMCEVDEKCTVSHKLKYAQIRAGDLHRNRFL